MNSQINHPRVQELLKNSDVLFVAEGSWLLSNTNNAVAYIKKNDLIDGYNFPISAWIEDIDTGGEDGWYDLMEQPRLEGAALEDLNEIFLLLEGHEYGEVYKDTLGLANGIVTAPKALMHVISKAYSILYSVKETEAYCDDFRFFSDALDFITYSQNDNILRMTNDYSIRKKYHQSTSLILGFVENNSSIFCIDKTIDEYVSIVRKHSEPYKYSTRVMPNYW
ncbi:hypothetical protein [Desulfonatronum thioautotrophicum]|uniref:hypothetical protein n=1 Tax=Desulfonatronum thioautotrophicum TaxID=617001 RepID=UPI0005EAEDAE|nr:hypothetical protein [Desulfonatronum thioautotrophicum]